MNPTPLATAAQAPLMSAKGQKQTCAMETGMSALL